MNQHIDDCQWRPCHPVGNPSWEGAVRSPEGTFQGSSSWRPRLPLLHHPLQSSGHQSWRLTLTPSQWYALSCFHTCLNRFCAFNTALAHPRRALRPPLKIPCSSVLLSRLSLLPQPQTCASSSSCFAVAGFCLPTLGPVRIVYGYYFPLGLIMPLFLNAAFGGSLVSNSELHGPVLSHFTPFFILSS